MSTIARQSDDQTSSSAQGEPPERCKMMLTFPIHLQRTWRRPIGKSDLASAALMLVLLVCSSQFPVAAAEKIIDGIQSIPSSNTDQLSNERHSGTPESETKYTIASVLGPLLIIGGLGGSLWVLTRKRKHAMFEYRNWLWLMAFTTSIAWWVISAVPKPTDNEKSLSVSVWFLFVSVYGAQSYRIVRNGYQFILTSLMGGIIATVLLAAYCDHAADDQRYRGRGMEGFVMHALSVGPVCLTVWVWIVTSVSQSIESQAQGRADGPTVELGRGEVP
ncbi:hypothetical protein Q7P37_003938 [Cladosporium fusiforme]